MSEVGAVDITGKSGGDPRGDTWRHQGSMPPPRPLSERLAGLFTRFCEADTSPDMKRLADSLLKESPEAILSRYQTALPMSTDELIAFVERWFVLPPEVKGDLVISRSTSLTDHIRALWPKLVRETHEAGGRSSLLPLPGRYVVPGGIFREGYYWDTYFTIVGLDRDHDGLREECVANLGYLIDTYGFVPNGNRTYYLSRSQPPLFFKAVELLAAPDPAEAFARYLPQLLREHAFWMHGAFGLKAGHAHRRVVAMPDGSILNRYWDDIDAPRDEAYRHDRQIVAAHDGRSPNAVQRDIRAACESGWDFSSRWFVDRRSIETLATSSIIPCDLNALLYGQERAIARGAQETGDRELCQEFSQLAAQRKQAMTRYLWNEDIGAFDDFEWRNNRQRNAITAASLFPLFCAVASAEQAASTAMVVERYLLAPGGIVTSLYRTGEQWDAPNGWAPLQWAAVVGLSKCGHTTLAKEIAYRWIKLVTKVHSATGRVVEKYDVLANKPGGGGEYPLQDGFGWTNGVTMALLKMYPEAANNGGFEVTSL